MGFALDSSVLHVGSALDSREIRVRFAHDAREIGDEFRDLSLRYHVFHASRDKTRRMIVFGPERERARETTRHSSAAQPPRQDGVPAALLAPRQRRRCRGRLELRRATGTSTLEAAHVLLADATLIDRGGACLPFVPPR